MTGSAAQGLTQPWNEPSNGRVTGTTGIAGFRGYAAEPGLQGKAAEYATTDWVNPARRDPPDHRTRQTTDRPSVAAF